MRLAYTVTKNVKEKELVHTLKLHTIRIKQMGWDRPKGTRLSVSYLTESKKIR